MVNNTTKNGLKVFALILSCALMGGGMGICGSFFGNYLLSEKMAEKAEEKSEESRMSTMMQGVRETSVLEVRHIDTSSLMTPAEVYAANVNSTVGITTSVTTNFWGFTSSSPSSGSGFIITDDGYIITNYHVIEDSDSITVSMYDGTTYDAKPVGYDESNDIAVLKVEAENLTPVVIGDSDALNVGDSVIAIGNPLGELTFSLTSGAVSALDREVTLSNSLTMDLIQTDCAINSGNSGGALFNLYGEVVGITNAKYSSSSSGASIDNIGFAIPINHIMGIVRSIIEDGYITKPYIGVSVADVSAEMQRYGLPKGAAVQGITEDSPADEAGLMINDIITAVNGDEAGSSSLVDAVGEASPGDVLILSVYRQGENIEIEVTVGEQVQSALANEETEEMRQIPGQGNGIGQIPGQNRQEGGNFPWGSFGR
ncbi:MAG: trypsin-like peptidase domain-containing protein [Bacteroidales bacterium]|nr:trypsin-like peptidase domain-containing protein [Lachnoclostridium sp.]MCM1383350.1 trypsin-like peptidase domain-containing protein [Lachnoclostridium sp.]MCM1465015.1 trypsin-like peptidase domain-containing protein [Bacteroidales bacterium]